MAPRRGGGGGGGGYSSSVENRCTINDAFSTSSSKVFIALVAIFFVGNFLVLCLWGRKRARNATIKHILRWYSYGISILFAVLSNAASIIVTTLRECGILYSSYWSATIIGNWLAIISKTILVIVVMLPVCSALYKMSGTRFTLVKWAHIGGATLIAIVAIVYQSMSTYNNANYLDIRSGDKDSLSTEINRMAAAHGFLMFFFSVSAGANIAFALLQMKRKGVTLGSLTIWAPVLVVLLWLCTLIDVVEIVRYYLMDNLYLQNSGLAITGISGLSLVLTYFSLLLLAGSPALNAPAAPSIHHGKVEEVAHPQGSGYPSLPIPSAYQAQSMAKPHPSNGANSAQSSSIGHVTPVYR